MAIYEDRIDYLSYVDGVLEGIDGPVSMADIDAGGGIVESGQDRNMKRDFPKYAGIIHPLRWWDHMAKAKEYKLSRGIPLNKPGHIPS